jgi:DNA polymerase III epsilon subunit-like protein
LDKLANWPNVLVEFHNMLNNTQRTVEVAPPGLSTPFRLLRLIVQNNTTHRHTAIEANFLYAAMHIACMKELRFHRETCPDLPESSDGLVQS